MALPPSGSCPGAAASFQSYLTSVVPTVRAGTAHPITDTTPQAPSLALLLALAWQVKIIVQINPIQPPRLFCFFFSRCLIQVLRDISIFKQ